MKYQHRLKTKYGTYLFNSVSHDVSHTTAEISFSRDLLSTLKLLPRRIRDRQGSWRHASLLCAFKLKDICDSRNTFWKVPWRKPPQEQIKQSVFNLVFHGREAYFGIWMLRANLSVSFHLLVPVSQTVWFVVHTDKIWQGTMHHHLHRRIMYNKWVFFPASSSWSRLHD